MKSWGSYLLNVTKTSRHSHLNPAFTIIELLVVIVVIGVLAAITIVSYTGVTNKAALASLQSDLSSASTKLKAYQTIYGSYPTLDTNNCPTAPVVDNNYCLNLSPNNSIATSPFSGYVPNNTTTPQTFTLTLTSNGIQGIVTESSKPTILAPAPLDPVADWIATPQGDHYGNYFDTVTKSWATVTRSTPKTIYDPNTQKIYDVPANKLAINPWNAYQPGGNGHAAVIEEARTNYLLNSSFDADGNNDGLSDYWGISKSIVGTPIYTLVDGVHGVKSQRLQYTGVPGDTIKWWQLSQSAGASTFSAGESVTGSIYLKGSVASRVVLRIMATDASSVQLGIVDTTIYPTQTMTKYTVNYPSLPANTDRCRLTILMDGIDNGEVFDITIDAAQLEKGAFATSYIPTTTAAVTREYDTITVPTAGWSASAGTISVVASHPVAHGGFHLVVPGNPSYNRINMYDTSGGVKFQFFGANNNLVTVVGNVAPDDGVVATGKYSGGSMVLYVNGVSSNTLTTDPMSGIASFAYIGSVSGAAQRYNGGIHRVIIYASALSDTRIQSLNSLKDGPQ